MATTSDRQHDPEPTPVRVEISQVSQLIEEATYLIHMHAAPVSALLAFHERKARLFEALAAEEPHNSDRQEVAKSARAQVDHLRAMDERGSR